MKAIIGGILTVVVLAIIAFFLLRSNTHFVSQYLPGNPAIQILPFADMPTDEASYVFREIKKLHANTVLIQSIPLPVQAYYAPRSRYRADTLIAWLLRRTPANCVTIGITSKDISTDKGSIADWGVMGLGYRPGNACVVSTYRLSRKNLREQLFKVAIHELGHTQGLPHCTNKSCYMRDAEGHNTTYEEYEFCPDCRRVMERKGWRFANGR